LALSADEATLAQCTCELVPLGTLCARIGGIHAVEGAPSGTRMVVVVTEARVDGERLKAGLKGPASADWGFLGADGTLQLDVRAALETDDGALILATFTGRADLSDAAAPGPVYAVPTFATGDRRYAWLTTTPFVMKGIVDLHRGMTYRIYELR